MTGIKCCVQCEVGCWHSDASPSQKCHTKEGKVVAGQGALVAVRVKNIKALFSIFYL